MCSCWQAGRLIVVCLLSRTVREWPFLLFWPVIRCGCRAASLPDACSVLLCVCVPNLSLSLSLTLYLLLIHHLHTQVATFNDADDNDSLFESRSKSARRYVNEFGRYQYTQHNAKTQRIFLFCLSA